MAVRRDRSDSRGGAAARRRLTAAAVGPRARRLALRPSPSAHAARLTETLRRRRVADMTPAEAEVAVGDVLAEAGGFPNSYCLTKAVAELLLAEAARSLPVAVVRPSIVTCAAHEPLPGWIDSLAGPAGMVTPPQRPHACLSLSFHPRGARRVTPLASGQVLAVALGALHTARGDPDRVVDFVPVDTVAAALLATAWHLAARPAAGACPVSGRPAAAASGELLVVHCATSGENPVSWGFMLRTMPGYYERHPSGQTRGRVHFRWARSGAEHAALHALLHVLPAAAADAVAWLRGVDGGTRLQAARLAGLLQPLTYFACNECAPAAAAAAPASRRQAPCSTAGRSDRAWPHRRWRFDTANLATVRAAMNWSCPRRAPRRACATAALAVVRRALEAFASPLPPPPPSRTKWTRRVPHPVLIGHVLCCNPA